MGNPFNKSDPFETTFENLTGQAAKAGQQVKKTVDTTAVAVGQDMKEQVFGEPDSKVNEAGDEATAKKQAEDRQKAEEKKQVNISQTRRNLESLNMEILKIRKEKIKKDKERLKGPAGEQRPKRAEEAQKKQEKESLLTKMLKGRQGSREVGKGVSG